jgi:MSHA biogenesis protein MshE
MAQQKKTLIGELLVKNQAITPEQLASALAKQQQDGRRLSAVLVELGYVSEETILKIVAEQFNVPFINLRNFPVDPNVVRRLPEATARRFRAIVLEETADHFLVGMVYPQDVVALDEINQVLQRSMELALVREADLLTHFESIYRHNEDITHFAQQLSAEVDTHKFNLAQLDRTADADEAPVVKLLQSIFEDAMRVHASDIHIEPDETVLRIRQRIDGVLKEEVMPDPAIAPALALRLKLMAGLKIAERRLPQDGRFSIQVNEQDIDVRLSTMPTQYGESVVMRLLNRSSATLRLEQSGMPAPLINTVRNLMKLPHGMILVTGPTGSGKTSTLYSILNELNNQQRKIITVEDPVEYRLARITQVQVNPQIDLTFARVLRAALRQDPDVIMVGEIRDKETAQIALRAALTGHFVLATMHTNDAISSTMRLLDMEGEGYMMASALRAVIAQRLLRRNCENCVTVYQPTAQENKWLRTLSGAAALSSLVFKQGKGCQRCSNTGYKGRIGVFELLRFDEEVSSALMTGNLAEFTKVAQQKGFLTLAQSALEIAASGVTSLQEIFRIAIDFTDADTDEAAAEKI